MRVNTRSSCKVVAGRCRRTEIKNGVHDKAASQREAVGGAIVALVVANSARTVAMFGALAATVVYISEGEVGHHGRSNRRRSRWGSKLASRAARAVGWTGVGA